MIVDAFKFFLPLPRCYDLVIRLGCKPFTL